MPQPVIFGIICWLCNEWLVRDGERLQDCRSGERHALGVAACRTRILLRGR